MTAPSDPTALAYRELREHITLLLPLVRAAEQAPGVLELPEGINASAMQYELDSHCSRCGRQLLYGLLGYLWFPHGPGERLCPQCYAPHQFREDLGPRYAQLVALSRQRPELMSTVLVAVLGQSELHDFRLVQDLGLDDLGFARLALCPQPRLGHEAEDIARLADIAGCAPASLADLLARAAAPPPPASREAAPADSAELDISDNDVPF
jgi:hypothetical protein